MAAERGLAPLIDALILVPSKQRLMTLSDLWQWMFHRTIMDGVRPRLSSRKRCRRWSIPGPAKAPLGSAAGPQ